MDYKISIQELISMIDDERYLRRIFVILSDYIDYIENKDGEKVIQL